MILHPPFIITSRLMAGITVGGGYLSIGYSHVNSQGRIVYDVWIDLPDGQEFHVTDPKSGCGGGDLQGGMESLLSFLSAAAESYAFRLRTGREGENEDLFEPAVVE